MLEATTAEAGMDKEMVTKAKVNGLQTSADKWQNENAKCSPDGEVVKLLETTNTHPSVQVIASTLPRTETQPTVKPPESLVNQPKVVPNPNGSDKQLLAQPQSSDRPLDAVQKTGLEEKKTNQKDAAASETEKNRPQAPAAAAPAPSTAADGGSNTVSSDVETAGETSLTVGERMASYLDPKNFNCVPAEEILSSKPFALDSTLLLITNLPACEAGCSYTEEEVVNLLSKFEFQYAHDNIYVIPQGGLVSTGLYFCNQYFSTDIL
ncbi:uncharacterized protein LOC118565939 [Fundulus heteroclitus]|uniref:uncharacterized protein LOC118565939 n=1 Tax=Fundulus heteroclitus TaxID=8078 RepID=UPI00165B1675|nr:uncharacterized protein LOC118565939 [Fundulus heteroclitus]